MKFTKVLSLASLVVGAALASSAHALPPSNVSGLLGTWYNTNPASNGIIRVVVTGTGSALKYTSYGSCSPTPCVHSTVVAYPHSASVGSNTAVGFTAYRNSGFKYERVDAVRTGSYLRLDSFNTFAAGDTRKNYVSTETFKK